MNIETLRPQWAQINWPIEKLQNHIAKAKCPKLDTRKELSEEGWQAAKDIFMSGNAAVSQKAIIAGTFYNENGQKTFLVWIIFKARGTVFKFDIYLPEKIGGEITCVRQIDERSPLCDNIISSIEEYSKLPVGHGKLLQTMGSPIWEGSYESKLQKKLNSHIQQTIFEDSCNELGISCIGLDPFDAYCYNGDPGKLADYDIIINGKTIRIDVKLVKDLEELKNQKAHDASLLIGSDWHSGKTGSFIVNEQVADLINNDKFNELLEVFSRRLREAGRVFLHIDSINLETDEVTFSLFGNDK